MALFRINVELHLSAETRRGLMRLVQATERQAAVLEALLAKADEPEVPRVLSDAIDEQAVVADAVAEQLTHNP